MLRLMIIPIIFVTLLATFDCSSEPSSSGPGDTDGPCVWDQANWDECTWDQ